MEKYRVYELAKELNTTSKRLMEKLAEINIVVKNHMSLLDDKELDALYNHIGVIKHGDNRKAEVEEKKTAPVTPQKVETKKDAGKDTKSAPRIIRTTEIIIDTKNDSADGRTPTRVEPPRSDVRGGDVRGNYRNGQKHDAVRVADANSGLRMGYVRDTRPEPKRDTKQANKVDMKKEPVREPVKVETRQEVKPEVKIDTSAVQKPDVKSEIPKETKPVVKTAVESEQKQVVRDADNQPLTKEIAKPQGDITPKDIKNGETAQVKPAVKDQVETKTEAVPERKEHTERVQTPPQRQHTPRPGNDGQRQPYDRNRSDRNQSDRNHGGYRPYGDRPQGDRPYGDRPYGDRPRGDRPQGGFRGPNDRPQGDRPRGDRPQGDRPYGDRPRGDRPQGGFRGPNDRPQGGGFRPQGDRPQGNRPYGDRPQSDRPRDGFRSNSRTLEIPKVEMTDAMKDEMNSQKSELRREFQNKDVDKDVKREQKKEVPKGQAGEKNKRFKPHKTFIGEKKGVSEILSEDFILEEFYDDDGVKKTRKTQRPKKNEAPAKYIPPKAVLTSITIPDTIMVKDLAEALKKTATEVIKKLMSLGMMVTLNHELDFDTAAIVAEEFGVKAEKAVVVNVEDILFDEDVDNDEELEPRPPVVVVMGHVDHGKTSLLDAIRETHVIESEAGGITQHIGAYTVKINNRSITFLDTPGHEAFTAMRARGAQVTDIAILVVAADDGVMPQTVEAINHAKAANVSIIVAINKIDKPGANPDRVKQELTEHGLVAEEWGGDVICVPVSAKKRENIDQLLEMVLLTADMLELKSNPDKQAKGTVIEAKLDKDRGALATILVQRGTLKLGDAIVTGTTFGRIRAMLDDKGHKLKKAGPSTPVEILGMPEVPEAGETFYAITDERLAKQLVDKRRAKQREEQLRASSRVTLDDLFNQIKEGKVKDLNIIVKADVQGSVEAVKQSLEKLSNDEVRVNIIHGGVGAVTESDVTLAQVSNAIIIGFNVRPAANVTDAAKDAGVDVRLYRIIYNAIEDIQAAMKGMLEPTYKEVVQGHAEIRQTFKVSGVGTIGGCYVTDGKIVRNSEVRVVRNGIVVHEGKLASLKRFKDDAKEVAQGFECGLSVERFNDIKEGDVVESYVMEEVAR